MIKSKHTILSVLLALFLTCILIPPSPALTPQEVAQTALASTVLVTMTNADSQSFYGSGFVIGTGQIATNYHVVEGLVSGTVRMVGQTTTHTIDSVIAIDPDRDLAILKASTLTAPALTLGDSDTVQVGQAVYAAGNPRGLTGTFSQGIVSAIRTEGINLVDGTVIQMTAAISPGSSGGPVLDTDGEVVGVAVGQVVDGQNLNFAIPVNYLEELITKTTQTVTIADTNLRAVIAAILGKTSSATITAGDMTTLMSLDGRNSNISSLAGLEHAVNLTSLSLGSVQVGNVWVNSNSVSDLTPLAGLTKMRWIVLTRNAVSDLSPLAGLVNLRELYLGGNAVTDISVLSSLTELVYLYLWDNTVTDISAVAGLTRLKHLHLWNNSVTDISALARLINLTELDLEGNSITNISVLLNLTKLEWITLKGNPITDTTPLCAIQGINPNLELDIEISCNVFGLFLRDYTQDGRVDISDLFFLLTILFGVAPNGDLNGDGRSDFVDLVLTAQLYLDSQANQAPSIARVGPGSPDMVRLWIEIAHAENDGSMAFQKGIVNLERFLAAMQPQETELLPNYPNPFNPETWIPYHLAHNADVTLTIFDTTGVMVRQLDLGHKQAGYYTDKTHAAYWDGCNALGETVGSGVYFYQLQAGEFSATRKLVILK